MSTVSIDQLKVTWPDQTIISGQSWEIRLENESRIVPIWGQSGSGKSSLLYTLATLKRPAGGRVKWEVKKGRDGASASFTWGRDGSSTILESDIRRNCFSYAPQGNNLLPFLTVGEHLKFIAEFRGTDHHTVTRDFAFLFPEGIGALLKSYSAALSGGQKKRVCLAMALAADPRVIFADEPTSGLDPTNRGIVIDGIQEWVSEDRSRSFFFVTHNQNDMEELRCSRRIVVSDQQAKIESR